MNVDLALALDVSGTLVFAVSGALLAVRKELDIVGVIVLAVAAGMGGGIIRDVLLGDTPPVAVDNQLYPIIGIVTGLLVFLFHQYVRRLRLGIGLWDALGLGFFAVSGTLKSLDAGVSPLPAVLLGVVTGVGGGMVRDLLALEVPVVLHRDIYALAALVGAVICTIAVYLDQPSSVAAFLGVSSTFILRVLAMRFGWSAPRPRDRL